MSTPWQALDEAERRLDSRAAERRRDRERRAARSRRLPWVLALGVLPVLGAALLLGLLELQGGDLGDWPRARANAVLAAALLWPVLASAFVTRRRPLLERVILPLATLLALVALVVGVGLVLLELGPA